MSKPFRIRRFLAYTVLAGAALLSVVFIVFLVRSFYVLDVPQHIFESYGYDTPPGGKYTYIRIITGLQSSRGVLLFLHDTSKFHAYTKTLDGGTFVSWRWGSGSPVSQSAQPLWLGFTYFHKDSVDSSTLAIGIPYWFLLLSSLTTTLVTTLYLRRICKRTRRALNLCTHCAYDLRASTDRCPECGTPFTPHPNPT